MFVCADNIEFCPKEAAAKKSTTNKDSDAKKTDDNNDANKADDKMDAVQTDSKKVTSLSTELPSCCACLC